MSRALVLGGGGPVGIGWEAGLISGLRDAGVDLTAADLVVGTSAGSVVGAQATLGADLAETVGIAGAGLPLPAGSTVGGEGMAALMDAMVKIVSEPGTPEEIRQRLGQVSASSETVDEDTFVALFGAAVAGSPWPATYACTAVDIDSGAFQLWTRDSGVPLERAVASSCSVPGLFPPVTIGGRRYMDGGMKTAMNADVAAGHDAVVAVSCFVLELPEGMSDPVFDALKGATDAELDTVRAAGALEVVTPGPEMLTISGWGMHLMDTARAQPAFEAGLRQAAVEVDRLRSLWG